MYVYLILSTHMHVYYITSHMLTTLADSHSPMSHMTSDLLRPPGSLGQAQRTGKIREGPCWELCPM